MLKKIGARRQPRSGGIPGMPNDGIKGRYLIEVKSTVGYSLGLKKEWLDNLLENAMARNKDPIMIVVFNHGGTCVEEEWAIIPLEKFKELSKDWKK